MVQWAHVGAAAGTGFSLTNLCFTGRVRTNRVTIGDPDSINLFHFQKQSSDISLDATSDSISFLNIFVNPAGTGGGGGSN